MAHSWWSEMTGGPLGAATARLKWPEIDEGPAAVVGFEDDDRDGTARRKRRPEIDDLDGLGTACLEWRLEPDIEAVLADSDDDLASVDDGN